jgi:hypothetical protein
LRQVIDRSGESVPGEVVPPEWLRHLRAALPASSLAGVYVGRRALDQARLASSGAGPEVDEEPLAQLVSRTYGAFQSFAVALDVSEGLELHLVERVNVERLDPALRRLLLAGHANEALLARVPADSMAVAWGQVDWRAVYDLVHQALPESEKTRVSQGELFLSGLLLGRELSGEILPVLGPGFLALIIKKETARMGFDRAAFPSAAVVLELANSPEVARALENALRSVLALVSLDPKRPPGSQVETLEVQGCKITRLVTGPSSFVFHVSPAWMILGNDEDLVADLASGKARSGGPAPLMQIRQKRFPLAQHFLVLDFVALADWIERHREPILRHLASQRQTEEDPGGDLDQALHLLQLFRAGYVTARVTDDGRIVHQSFGLLPK